MAQLMPLPLTVSRFSKIQIGFTFLVPAHRVVPEKRPLNGCVCGLEGPAQDPQDPPPLATPLTSACAYLVFDVDVGAVVDEQSHDVHVVVNESVEDGQV